MPRRRQRRIRPLITRENITQARAAEERDLAGGVRAVRGVVDRARRAALAAFKDGAALHAPQAAAYALRAATPIVAQAMAVGHLRGRERSIYAAAHAPRRAVRLANPYQGAMDFLRRRMALTPDQAAAVTARYGPMAARATGQMAAGVEEALQVKISDILSRGLHVRQGVAELRMEFNALGLGGTPDAADYRLETLFRTQHQIAYGAGRWQAIEDPAIWSILWGFEYVTVRDDRVRPAHRALDRFRAPKESPIWLRIWPPNGYNCRCDVLEIFDGAEDATPRPFEPLVINGRTVEPRPDPGWEWNPGRVIPSDLWSSSPLGSVALIEYLKGLISNEPPPPSPAGPPR